jgi:hypothetical protein
MGLFIGCKNTIKGHSNHRFGRKTWKRVAFSIIHGDKRGIFQKQLLPLLHSHLLSKEMF